MFDMTNRAFNLPGRSFKITRESFFAGTKFLDDAKDNHDHTSRNQLTHWVFKLPARKSEPKIKDGSKIYGEQPGQAAPCRLP